MIKRTLCTLLLGCAFLVTTLTGCQPQADPSSGRSTTTPAPIAATTTQPATATATSTDTTTTGPTQAPPTTALATSPTTPAPDGDQGVTVAALAKSLVGTPFRLGAAGPDAFDNSGFLVYCYQHFGIPLPRKTGEIAKAGTAVERADLQPGDAVFFYNDTPGAAQYAGIYIGDGRFVSCNNEDSPTKIQDLRLPYFTQHYVGARRFS